MTCVVVQFGAVAEKDPPRVKFPNEHCTFPLRPPDAEKNVVPVKIVPLPPPLPEQLASRVEPKPVPFTCIVEVPTVVTVTVATPMPPIPTQESPFFVPPEAGRETTTLHESVNPPALAVRSTVQIKFFGLTVNVTERKILLSFVLLVKVTISKWVVTLSAVALLLTATSTFVLSPGASEPPILDKLNQLTTLDTSNVMSEPPSFFNV